MRAVLGCYFAGAIAGVVAFMDDNRVTIAEVLFVAFFVAGMALLLRENVRVNGGGWPILARLVGRSGPDRGGGS